VIPTTFEELEASNYTIGLQYLKGTPYEMLKTTSNPVYKRIFEKMELEPDDAKCFERAIKTKFGCISWASIAEFVYHRNLSDKSGQAPVTSAPVMVYFQFASIVVQQRASFRTNLDKVVIRATDSGLMDKWKAIDFLFVRRERRNWEQKINKTMISYRSEKNGPLTISNLCGSFFLLVGGTAISFLVFVMEIYQGRQFRPILLLLKNFMRRI